MVAALLVGAGAALLFALAALPAGSALSPLSPPRALAQGIPDCDNDNDAGIDPNEYNECYPAPQPSGKLFTPQDKEDILHDAYKHLGDGVYHCIGAAAAGILAIPGAETGPLDAIPISIAAKFGKDCADDTIHAAGDGVKLKIDPFDPHFDQIALLTPVGKDRVNKGVCHLRHGGGQVTGQKCKRLQKTLRKYQGAVTNTTALSESQAITANRYSSAVGAGDTENALLQQGVSNTLSGLLASALNSESKAGGALAKALKHAGIRFRATRRQVKAAKRQLVNHPPSAAVAQLQADGLSLQEIKQALAYVVALPGSKKIKKVNSFKWLGARVSTGGLLATYNSIEPGQLAAMVRSLSLYGFIDFAANINLNNSLQNMRLDCNPEARLAAARQFSADAGVSPGGPFGAFLQAAVKPLTVSSATIPPCRAG